MSEEVIHTPYFDKDPETGRILPGGKGGPGRPKGKTMKEFARDFLMSMTDEMKLEFLNSLSKEVLWKMAEGNPHNTEDITSGGKPIPIYVPGNDRPQENKPIEQTNSSDTGGDIGQ